MLRAATCVSISALQAWTDTPEIVGLQLDMGDAYQGEIILHQLIEARHLRSDLKERLGNLSGALRAGLLQFLLEKIHMQENRSERITDFMGHARRQAAEQGEVLGTLGFAFQALPLGHFAA
jgi:hypothetical protein